MNPIDAFKAASATVKALVILAVVLLITGLIAWHLYTRSAAADTTAKLATGQGAAAAKSTTDAVATIGNTADAATATDDLTRNNADAIDRAQGSQAKIDAPAQDAGLRALCQRIAYRDTPLCAAYR